MLMKKKNAMDAPPAETALINVRREKQERLSWRRFLQVCFLVLFIVVTVPFVISMSKLIRALFAWEHTVNATLTLLKSEELLFLVTDKLITQIMVEATDNNPILGKREGVLVGTVTLYYGVDLRKLNTNSVMKEGTSMLVAIPDPQELDFSVDLSSLKFITKKSGLNVIVDFVLNKDMESELRAQLKSNAIQFFMSHDLVPTRQKIVSKLNGFAPVFSEKTGMRVEFR